MTKTLIWLGVVAAIFAVLWWRGYLKRFATYWQEMTEELKKCTWPSWAELKGSTVVVAISTALLGAFTFIVDSILFGIFIKL